ncbi:MAG: hypothetical protein Q9175_001620 [Cornicularia normoerica]
MQPRVVPIEPRGFESLRRRPSSKDNPRGPIEGLALKIKFWNPFSSKMKEKTEKKQYYFVRRMKRSEPRPAFNQHQPPIPPPPAPQFVPSVRGGSPVVIPIQPSHSPHHLPEREPRRRTRPTPVVIPQSSEEDEDSSSSPPEANREHVRRTRSLSPISRYLVEKETIRLRELRQRELRERERRQRIGREEREARERAERVAIDERLERQREREERSERREQNRQERRDLQQRLRLATEREARRQQQLEEQARLLQEQEDRERRRAANRAGQLREAQARRRQEEEDIERRRAADRDRLRRLRDEQARRQYAEQQRYARARQANIPRRPRHPVFVHHYEDRGERFIQDAIMEENLRQFERRARRPRGGYDDGALRRRNTIDGGRYDGQRWRRERR